nr:hypothetical protein [uncultured Cupriavidus sp.]
MTKANATTADATTAKAAAKVATMLDLETKADLAAVSRAASDPRDRARRSAADLEEAHLDAAAELLRRHGLSLADCRVSRECAGLDAVDDAVLYVVQVGEGVDVFALNEALTALQYARGLSPSAQLDVVFAS